MSDSVKMPCSGIRESSALNYGCNIQGDGRQARKINDRRFSARSAVDFSVERCPKCAAYLTEISLYLLYRNALF